MRIVGGVEPEDRRGVEAAAERFLGIARAPGARVRPTMPFARATRAVVQRRHAAARVRRFASRRRSPEIHDADSSRVAARSGNAGAMASVRETRHRGEGLLPSSAAGPSPKDWARDQRSVVASGRGQLRPAHDSSRSHRAQRRVQTRQHVLRGLHAKHLQGRHLHPHGSAPAQLGTEFVFTLTIRTVAEPLKLRGRVKWVVSVEEATADQPAGMGIEFLYASEEERHSTEAIVEKLMGQDSARA